MGKSAKISYQHIKTSVLQRIRNNTWPPDTIMPGEVELAKEFGCARATVNRAMRELADEGYLDRKRKAGTRVKASPTRQAKFIIPLTRQEIENTGVEYRYELLRREKLAAPEWLSARMSLPENAEVIHLQCMHYAASKPFQFEDRWINLQAVPKADQTGFEAIGPNEWLVNEVPFTDAEISFSASAASAQVAGFLSVSQGTALFTIERTTWLDGLPVTYAKLFFAAGYQKTTRL